MTKSNLSNASSDARTFTLPFLLFTVLFCVCLIVANLVEIKTVDLGFTTITAGMVVFPLSYIINDCIVEVYGFRKARMVIWLGFGMNFFVTMLLQLAILLPGAEGWNAQDAMVAIYGGVPRIFIASFLAFICGSMVNALVMSKMKVLNKGKYFSLRAILSTVFGEGADSVIFFPLAFFGTLPLDVIIELIVAQTCLKTLYEIIILPVTIRVVRYIKRIEHLDTYDNNINYSWW
jgi:hypothetical protein